MIRFCLYPKSIFTFNQKGVLGKIWTDDIVLPGQEAFNIEGNVSNELLRKNYLVDQFYGIKDLFAHYHMPGDGNIRGLVNENIEGAEALVAVSNELVLTENFYDISSELALFTDFGAFFHRKIIENHPKDNGKRPRQIYDFFINLAGQFWVTFKKLFGNCLHEKTYLLMNFPIPVLNLPPDPRNIERSDKK